MAGDAGPDAVRLQEDNSGSLSLQQEGGRYADDAAADHGDLGLEVAAQSGEAWPVGAEPR
jgi:hypothetical protein